MITGPTIALASGAYFSFERLNVEDVTILDIAHGLANTCRFGGQCQRFYSVAEHSVLASLIVPPEHAWAALMHDAPEALLGDIPSPLKRLLPDYRALEARVEAALFARFDVPHPLPEAVKWADRAMLAREQITLFSHHDAWATVAGEPPAPVHPILFTPEQARNMFLNRHDELLTERTA